MIEKILRLLSFFASISNFTGGIEVGMHFAFIVSESSKFKD